MRAEVSITATHDHTFVEETLDVVDPESVRARHVEEDARGVQAGGAVSPCSAFQMKTAI